jgi:hypothetical protein
MPQRREGGQRRRAQAQGRQRRRMHRQLQRRAPGRCNGGRNIAASMQHGAWGSGKPAAGAAVRPWRCAAWGWRRSAPQQHALRETAPAAIAAGSTRGRIVVGAQALSTAALRGGGRGCRSLRLQQRRQQRRRSRRIARRYSRLRRAMPRWVRRSARQTSCGAAVRVVRKPRGAACAAAFATQRSAARRAMSSAFHKMSLQVHEALAAPAAAAAARCAAGAAQGAAASSDGACVALRRAARPARVPGAGMAPGRTRPRPCGPGSAAGNAPRVSES